MLQAVPAMLPLAKTLVPSLKMPPMSATTSSSVLVPRPQTSRASAFNPHRGRDQAFRRTEPRCAIVALRRR
jgi:hypothetical protein